MNQEDLLHQVSPWALKLTNISTEKPERKLRNALPPNRQQFFNELNNHANTQQIGDKVTNYEIIVSLS